MKVTIGRKTIAATAAAVLVAAGSGAAIAANAAGSPAEESKAVVEDAAQQLGVDSAKLSAALEKALTNRVDAALAAGRITEAQATEMKQRIAADDFPLVGFGGRGGPDGHHGFGHHGGPIGLEAAASYLGVEEAALRTSLENGDTLAEVAKARGKSVDGLVAALVAAAKQQLAADVAAGRLTDAKRDDIVASLQERVTEAVNDTRAPRPDRELPDA